MSLNNIVDYLGKELNTLKSSRSNACNGSRGAEQIYDNENCVLYSEHRAKSCYKMDDCRRIAGGIWGLSHCNFSWDAAARLWPTIAGALPLSFQFSLFYCTKATPTLPDKTHRSYRNNRAVL